jgi:hypothetical protein
MGIGQYIEVDGVPQPCADTVEWAKWWSTANRQVALTEVGRFYVSTVFLGIDHNFGPAAVPILYETMVFFEPGAAVDDYQERYATRAQALVGHERAVAWARAKVEDKQ